jgi:hypothetical protein
MAVMVNPAKMETREAQAQTPPRKTRSCQHHHNATAWPNPAQLVQLAPRAPMDHQAITAVQAEMVNPDLKAHLVHLAQLAATATTALLVHLALLVT